MLSVSHPGSATLYAQILLVSTNASISHFSCVHPMHVMDYINPNLVRRS